jgi:hypothetical protein
MGTPKVLKLPIFPALLLAVDAELLEFPMPELLGAEFTAGECALREFSKPLGRFDLDSPFSSSIFALLLILPPDSANVLFKRICCCSCSEYNTAKVKI